MQQRESIGALAQSLGKWRAMSVAGLQGSVVVESVTYVSESIGVQQRAEPLSPVIPDVDGPTVSRY